MMKKLICVLMSVLVLMSSMAVYASANSGDTLYFEIDGCEYTVEYVSGDNLSDAKKAFIAAKLVGAEVSQPSPANILCDIFGHDYLYSTEKVTAHKVYSSSPRCEIRTYSVTTCEDCDYYQETLTTKQRIVCCS